MPYAQRGKITLATLGEPSIIKTMDEKTLSFELGVILGEASDVVERSNPKDGSIIEGLKGQFRAIPTDEKRDTVESGILFIPDAFHVRIAEPIREAKAAGDKQFKIKFAFKVMVIRANNPQKYSWELKPVLEDEGKNPLDALQAEYEKALAAPPKQKAIGSRK